MPQSSIRGQIATHRHLEIAKHKVEIERGAHHFRQALEAHAAVRSRLDHMTARSEHAHDELNNEWRIID